MNVSKTMLKAVVITSALIFSALTPVNAEEPIVAKINGQSITEVDMKLAETEIGRDLGQLPPGTRRRVLVEYLIENYLFAEAAEKAKLDSGPAFDERMRYMRRRALRETYFEEKIRKSVSETAAEVFYKDRVKTMKPTEEVKARHILVKSEESARDISEQLARGGDFADLAKNNSMDPGTKDKGGMLGYFSAGQMVPAFEKAAFALKKGEVSDPVESRFGWHIIKLEERRQKPIPKFSEVKDQILNSLVHQQTQTVADQLRKTATVEYIDPIIKAVVEASKKKQNSQQQQFEQQVKEMQKKKEAQPEQKK